jgi:hypothetical protein
MNASSLLWVVGIGAALLSRGVAADAPLVINAPEQAHLDLSQTDGGLLPVHGAENYGVFRASRARPDLADGKGYTYNHHQDLAAWRGKLYVAWDSGAKDEDTWPARELYSTSANGRDWTPPAELFPQGVSTPTRLYFFHAANLSIPGQAKAEDRMLAFAGLRLGHENTDEAKKNGIVVREIRGDHTLGPVFTLRPPPGGPRAGDPPVFSTAGDAGFVAACRTLLAAHVTLETQDYGVFLDPADRNAWHDPGKWPGGRIGNGFWKAPSFFHRRDGALVGIGKNGWTSLSRDDGATWSLPVVPPTLVTNNAKVWGTRTADGRYALIYNPTLRPRYPLAMVTSDDGVTFGPMRAVQDHFPPQRYPGINKNPGLQYIRGIAEWASDGSWADAQRALWLVYSSNKEDIWVSRVPVPIVEGGEPAWNSYQPAWSRVTATGDTVGLSTREPFDFAGATKLFAPTSKVAVTLTIAGAPHGLGALDIELLGGFGGARPVRLRLAGDGVLRAIDGIKMIELGESTAGAPLALRIEADCVRKRFTVSVGGKHVAEAQFADTAPALQRLVLRAWARADADRGPQTGPATALVGPEFDRPADEITYQVTGVTIAPGK